MALNSLRIGWLTTDEPPSSSFLAMANDQKKAIGINVLKLFDQSYIQNARRRQTGAPTLPAPDYDAPLSDHSCVKKLANPSLNCPLLAISRQIKSQINLWGK